MPRSIAVAAKRSAPMSASIALRIASRLTKSRRSDLLVALGRPLQEVEQRLLLRLLRGHFVGHGEHEAHELRMLRGGGLHDLAAGGEPARAVLRDVVDGPRVDI